MEHFNKTSILLFFCAIISFVYGSQDLVHTPLGLYHKKCILQVPSGTTVHHEDKGLGFSLIYPDGSKASYGECTQKNQNGTLPSLTFRPNQLVPSYWDGWSETTKFGVTYQSHEDVVDIYANWNVPNTPKNTRANASSPWPAPVFYSSISMYGEYRMMPVLEWNGIIPNTWDLVSWCTGPSGYAIHSQPLYGKITPGATLYGNVFLTGKQVYKVSAAVSGGSSVTLVADLSKVTGFSPRWVTATLESKYVTRCDQLPNNPTNFFGFHISTTSGPVKSIPWQQTIVCNTETPCPVMCNGNTAVNNNGSIAIGYSGSDRAKFSKVSGRISDGLEVFSGTYTVEDAMEVCRSMSLCTGITVNLNSNFAGMYQISGKSSTHIEPNNSWVSYIKTF